MSQISWMLGISLALICIMPLSMTAGQESGNEKEIAPPDVFVAVDLVRQEVESIRFVMGKPENKQPELGIRGAAPREVYFQALTMFRKADRLCFEYTRRHSEAPELPTGTIQAADVFAVVTRTLACVQQVKKTLGIEAQSTPLRRDDSKQPNDVFLAAVQVNRQLNLLLDQEFAPSDVFQQVTLGIGYTSRLLETFPDATTIPDEPELEIGLRPSDVYRRLVENFSRIRAIAQASGVEMLEMNVDIANINAVEPSDVYDIASLLVSELAYLHSQLSTAQPAREVYFAGRKFPSHVYQRAGILERQLIELETLSAQNPRWLGK